MTGRPIVPPVISSRAQRLAQRVKQSLGVAAALTQAGAQLASAEPGAPASSSPAPTTGATSGATRADAFVGMDAGSATPPSSSTILGTPTASEQRPFISTTTNPARFDGLPYEAAVGFNLETTVRANGSLFPEVVQFEGVTASRPEQAWEVRYQTELANLERAVAYYAGASAAGLEAMLRRGETHYQLDPVRGTRAALLHFARHVELRDAFGIPALSFEPAVVYEDRFKASIRGADGFWGPLASGLAAIGTSIALGGDTRTMEDLGALPGTVQRFDVPNIPGLKAIGGAGVDYRDGALSIATTAGLTHYFPRHDDGTSQKANWRGQVMAGVGAHTPIFGGGAHEVAAKAGALFEMPHGYFAAHGIVPIPVSPQQDTHPYAACRAVWLAVHRPNVSVWLSGGALYGQQLGPDFARYRAAAVNVEGHLTVHQAPGGGPIDVVLSAQNLWALDTPPDAARLKTNEKPGAQVVVVVRRQF